METSALLRYYLCKSFLLTGNLHIYLPFFDISVTELVCNNLSFMKLEEV